MQWPWKDLRWAATHMEISWTAEVVAWYWPSILWQKPRLNVPTTTCYWPIIEHKVAVGVLHRVWGFPCSAHYLTSYMLTAGGVQHSQDHKICFLPLPKGLPLMAKFWIITKFVSTSMGRALQAGGCQWMALTTSCASCGQLWVIHIPLLEAASTPPAVNLGPSHVSETTT